MLARVVLGVMLVGLGLVAVVWPYRVAKIDETLDAIGRKQTGPVEPADWSVTVTRLVGAGILLAGLWLVVVGLGTT